MFIPYLRYRVIISEKYTSRPQSTIRDAGLAVAKNEVTKGFLSTYRAPMVVERSEPPLAKSCRPRDRGIQPASQCKRRRLSYRGGMQTFSCASAPRPTTSHRAPLACKVPRKILKTCILSWSAPGTPTTVYPWDNAHLDQTTGLYRISRIGGTLGCGRQLQCAKLIAVRLYSRECVNHATDGEIERASASIA